MVTQNKIILSACKELKLSPEVFMSGLRERAYMDAKRICVGLLLESEDMTLKEVAGVVGLTNHTSAMHLRNTYNNLMKTDWVFRRKRDRIKISLINQNNMESLIGKQYVPRDNSYCSNLTNGEDRRLAGTAWQDAQVTTISSEPYDKEVPFNDDINTYQFIKVIDCRNEEHEVMFFTRGIVTESNTVESMLNGDQFRYKWVNRFDFF